MRPPPPPRALLAAIVLTGAGCADPQLHVSDAWIRAPAPGATSAAAYLTLDNGLDDRLQLTGAHSAAFAAAMIHTTVTEGGMTRMAAATPLAIAPGGRVVFRPGGLHIMLMQPQRPLTEGDRIQIELQFDAHDPVSFLAEVRRRAP